MPSGFTHALAAERASAFCGVTPVERDAYHLGALGPDLFFFCGMFPLRLSSRPNKLGNRLHQLRTGAFLCALCDQARLAGDVERAYAMGFLTHYALDSTVHPYVYACSYLPDGTYSSPRHMRLERCWDAHFYRQTEDRGGQPWLLPGVEESRRDWPRVSRLLCDTLAAVYPEESMTSEDLLTTLEGVCRLNRLAHTPRGVKYVLVWALERLAGKPGLLSSQLIPPVLPRDLRLNEAHAPWHSPFAPDQERTESVPDLLDQGIRRGAALLVLAQQRFDGEISEEAFADGVGNLRYDSGMPGEA